MTGMPHPHAVEVVVDRRKLAGCGGDPATLLHGREWVVADINGKGIVDRSRATLDFFDDGRVAGRASCNNFTAQYTLTGETLTVSKAAGTMMACEPALMAQERLFLDVLQNVRRFDLRPDGALVLQTDDGRAITARR
jgi:heat shock protein HslJ